jgi:hypothetical protein
MAERPSHQRWIKRPPRPSRAAPVVVRRVKPGLSQALVALAVGVALGLLGAMLAPHVTDKPGMAGLFAGLGLAGGFFATWRFFGGTRQDVRDLFR